MNPKKRPNYGTGPQSEKLNAVNDTILTEYAGGLSIRQLAAKYEVAGRTMQLALQRFGCVMREAKHPIKLCNRGDATCGHGKAHTMGLCRNCYERDLRRRNPEFAQRQRDNCDKWHGANQERLKIYRKSSAKKETTETRRRRYFSAWGISEAQFLRQLELQDFKCPVCGKEFDPKRTRDIHIDHNHITGEWRGLLCFRCNFGLGWFQDDPAKLERAYNYMHGSHAPDIFLDGRMSKGTSKRIHVGPPKERK